MDKKPTYEKLEERVRELEKLAIANNWTDDGLQEIEELSNLDLSELLANISHEFRTPINAIIEMTELALDTHLTKQQRDYLETVRMSAGSLPGLLNNILDLSKIEAHRLELEMIDFDLRNTLENASDMLGVKAEEAGLGLFCQIDPDVPTVLTGDPGRLRQIIVNLTENVIKFTKKGKVLIRVETEKKRDSSVILHFIISALTTGIRSDRINTVFDRSGQLCGSTTKNHSSLEWGLTISKQLVEMMEGRLWGESEAGLGSNFHFTVRFGLSRTNIENIRYLSGLDLSGVPVLIVDDNEINRLVFHEMTSSWGLIPSEAVDGKEALVKIKKAFDCGEPYRLVLMDLQIPEIDGFEVAKKVKESSYGENVEIILLTSVGQNGDAAHCREVGISGYLLRPPVSQSELLDAIIMVLGCQAKQDTPIITRHTIQEARRRLNVPLLAAA